MSSMEYGRTNEAKGFLDRFFKLTQHGTSVKTEFFAGITMFIASVYILAVIPNLLSVSGMPHASAVAAVVLTTAFATMLIGLVANVPVIVAPGLGLSAFFSYTICGAMGLSWQTALGAVFISGTVFVILTVTKVLNKIVDGIPQVLKTSIGVGIGLFVAFIGFKNAHIIVPNNATFVTLGNMQDPAVLLTLLGLFITSILLAKQVKGGLLIGMVFTTIAAMGLGLTKMPATSADIFNLVPPVPVDTFAQLDIMGAIKYGIFSIIFSITIVDMFDNIGTLGGHISWIYSNRFDNKLNNPAMGANFRFHLKDSDSWVHKAINGVNLMAEVVPGYTDVKEDLTFDPDGAKYQVNLGMEYSFWKDYINAVVELNRYKYFSGGLVFKLHLK